jgi:hypothetical protein
MPRQVIIDGYCDFVSRFTKGAFQYSRLKNFMDNLENGNYIPLQGGGYISYGDAFKIIVRSPTALMQILKRLIVFSWPLSNYYWFFKAALMVMSHTRISNRMGYLRVWFALWTNVLLRYKGISEKDFDIDSVSKDFDFSSLVNDGRDDDGDSDADKKNRAQRRFTQRSLEMLAKPKV